MTKKLIFLILIFLGATIIVGIFKNKSSTTHQIKIPTKEERTWQIKSIDTMKYSRDLALANLNDPSFDQTIDSQIVAISNTRATHVVIATPYDEEFYKILKRWVDAARRYNLHVWFRGNFSGWEGWFSYDKSVTREDHIKLTQKFINDNQNLFLDGDIFSPCPECENGGPGDPRASGDVEAFRKFMIEEHNVAQEEFKKINKKVATNFASMNLDVARLVMDRQTTESMDNLIVIDHYAKSPQRLSQDIDDLSQRTGAKIFLGEIGAPIPDITGPLDQAEQAAWLDEALSLVAKKPSVIGLNYWVAVGGQTAIFNGDSSPKPAAVVLKNYFSLTRLD